MKVNLIAEDFMFFKYIGCCTAAKMLFRGLSEFTDVEASWNSREGDFDIVHFHTFGPGALIYKKFSKGVKIITAHSTPRLNTDNLAFSGLLNLMYPPLYRSFDHIITISKPCEKEVKEMAPDVSTTLLPNGIDLKKFRKYPERRKSFRKIYGIGKNERVILSVGQQTPRKGIIDFLDVAKRLSDCKFVWVGGLPYGIFSKGYFKIKKAKEEKSENVIFTGFIPDIRDAYSGSDVFFMPSHAEGMSIVMLEALASRMPCVVRNIPEFREIFGKTGLYFNDIVEAAYLLDSENKLKKAAKKSRSVASRYDIRKVAKMHEKLYEKLA